MNNFWISSDLDGTLLDHTTYSYQAALPALALCQSLGIPIVLNTSKTVAETLAIHTALDLTAPMIVENGSALVFPNRPDKTQIFGAPRERILAFIDKVRSEHNFRLSGFNDWSIDTLQSHTGLSSQNAVKAAAKEYSEPFLWQGNQEQLTLFMQLAHKQNLQILKGGRFYHLQGATDKAKPLAWIKQHIVTVFAELEEGAKLIGLGDNHNDIAMLNYVDLPVCIKTPSGDFPSLQNGEPAYQTQGIGPAGWNEAINLILTKTEHSLNDN